MKKSKKNNLWLEVWRRYRKNKAAMVGLAILVVFILMAVFADVITPYETCIKMNGPERLQAPSAAHWLGTDTYGRDVFARIVHGARVSLIIGVATSIIALVVGGLLGAIAAYYGGKVDNIIMRIMDVFMSIPAMMLALAIVCVMGGSMVNLVLAITIANVPRRARVVRSAILTASEMEYVEAARSYGTRDMRIILRYILPNALGPIIVNTTMGIAGMILTAASLSFLGMGIQPPQPEWGSMLSEARAYIRTKSYLLLGPGIAIMLAALSFNLIGDGLRDALDPKLKD